MKILLYILLVSCVSVRSAFHSGVVYLSLNVRIIGVLLLLGASMFYSFGHTAANCSFVYCGV